MNAANADRAMATKDPLEALQQRRWAEVPLQWRSLVYDLRDPLVAQHFSRFYETGPVLNLQMPDAPELWQRELAWWVAKRANGYLGRQNAIVLARVVHEFNEMAKGATAVPSSLTKVDEASWIASQRERFVRRRGRFPDPRYVDNLLHYVRMILASVTSGWSTDPWWVKDVWSPRTDPRIVLRDHEPNGDSVVRLDIVKPRWLLEAQRFWLHMALDTHTMVWTSIKSRLFYVGGVFGNFCDERGIDDPLLTRDTEIRPVLSDFSEWMRHQPSRRNGRSEPLRPGTRDGVRSAVQGFYTFMFDEKFTAAKETNDQRWLDLTPGYTNLWRPYDNDRRKTERRHVSRGRFIEPVDLRRMVDLIGIMGTPKDHSVHVSIDGQPRTFAGLGDEQVMRAWMIQQLTGRRASEILMMDYRPLETLSGCVLDSEGEPDEVIARMTYQQTKVTGVDNTILVDRAVVRIVAEQQDWVRRYLQLASFEGEPKYLFVQQVRNTRGHYPRALSSYNRALRGLDKLVQLTDQAGQRLAFSESHRLRHSRATELLNAGAPVHVVQRYMGHFSPEMTMRYAQTLAKTAEEEFLRTIKVGRDGRPSSMSAQDIYDIAQLSRHTDRILPDGICLLPPLKSCDKGNACKTCDHYVTDRTHLQALRLQLEQTKTLVSERSQEFLERHGRAMTPDNVWLEQRTQEVAALGRIIAALESDLASGAGVRGAGVLARAGYGPVPLTLTTGPVGEQGRASK